MCRAEELSFLQLNGEKRGGKIANQEMKMMKANNGGVEKRATNHHELNNLKGQVGHESKGQDAVVMSDLPKREKVRKPMITRLQKKRLAKV